MFQFKKYLSFLFDILLEQKSTPYNPVLKLYLSKGQLKLVTQGAVYSYGNLYYNFRESFNELGISNQGINKVLILGLGTGSIIQLLEQKFHLKAHYEVVEIDPGVVELFGNYKMEYINSICTIHIADAIEYMKSNQKTYDLICMDIFCDCIVPENFESEEFLLNLKIALNENGILMYNRLAINAADQTRNERFCKTFEKIFPEFKIIKMKFNWMLVADKRKDDFF